MSYDAIFYDGDIFALVASGYVYEVGSKILESIFHGVPDG
jgi:hypothetical protein